MESSTDYVMKIIIRFILRAIFCAVFAGFIAPLYYAHSCTLGAIRYATGPPDMVDSFPYLSEAEDASMIGYIWCGCSMVWLFWYVTRKTKNVAEQVAASDR